MSPFPHNRIVLLILASCLPLTCGVGVTVLHGDVYVDVILSLYTNSNGTCGTIDAEVVQNLHAIVWTFEKLNVYNYLYNGTIGVRVYETCRDVNKAALSAQEIAMDLYSSSQNMKTVGVIGSDFSSETEAVSRLLGSLPTEFRLLQLGFAATSASLRDKDKFTNFFRTIPPDDIQVEVMTAFLRDLDFTYMAAVYDDDAYGRGGVEALVTSVQDSDVCFGQKIAINPAESEQKTLQILVESLTALVSMNATDGSLPRGGILLFGSLNSGKLLMQAIAQVYTPDLGIDSPVLLFSEGSSYFEGQFLNVSKGAFVLSPPRRTISEFQTDWTNTLRALTEGIAVHTYKWLREVYEHTFSCTLSLSCTSKPETQISDNFPSSLFTQYAIQAALTLAKVTKNVATAVCGGTTLCSEFFSTPRQAFIDEMDYMVVQFDDDFLFRIAEFKTPDDLVISFNGTAEVQMQSNLPIYQVYNHQRCQPSQPSQPSEPSQPSDDFCFVEVANYYSADNFQVTKADIKDYATANGTELSWPDIRKAQCPDGAVCTPCLTGATDDILFIRGSMYVVGIVPIHSVGDTPLTCGGIKGGGLDIVEAIRFAITDAKATFVGNVPDADIGVIAIDSCNDAQVIQEKVLSLHRHGVYRDGSYIPVNDQILGYIGSWSSDVSVAVAEITSRLGFVQISYGSTATVLSKRSLYPYFLRVPSPDSSQVDTMLKVVEDLGANYVQIIHSDSAYGNGGRDLILDRVGDMNICVAQVIPITNVDTTGDLVGKIKRHPKARVLLVFTSSFEMLWMLEALNTNFYRNEFVYIASEGWGTRDIVNDYTNLIGTITLSSELPSNTQYKGYLKDLAPDVPDADPWIRAYMEHQFQCYYQWSYNKSSGNPCTGTERLDADNQYYKIDPWAAFTKKAVYALLKGAHPALSELCNSVTELCPSFRENPGVFADKIIQARLDDGFGSLKRVFDDNGDGLAGYHINVVTLDVENNYESVGEANPSGLFQFNKELWQTITGLGADVNSSCSSRDVCPVCFPDSESVVLVKDSGTSLAPGVIAVLAVLALLCCVLAGILLYICNRHGCCIKLENGKPRLTNTYLSPIYLSERPHPPDGSDFSHAKHHRRPVNRETGNYDYILEDRVSAGSAGRRGPDGGAETTQSSGFHEGRSTQDSGGTSAGSYGSRSHPPDAPRGCSNQSLPRIDARNVSNQSMGSQGDSNQGASNESYVDDEVGYSLGEDTNPSQHSAGYLHSVKTSM